MFTGLSKEKEKNVKNVADITNLEIEGVPGT